MFLYLTLAILRSRADSRDITVPVVSVDVFDRAVPDVLRQGLVSDNGSRFGGMVLIQVISH